MTTEYKLVVYLVLRTPTYLKKKKDLSDGMKWNGQGLTADSNEYIM